MVNVQEILAPDRARVGRRKTAIYAGPQWVRPDGNTWRRIDEVVSVQQLADGGYRLAYGGAWVELRPDAASSVALAAATKRAIVRGRVFGPVLDADIAPDSLVWRVTASGDVKRRKDLWLLGEPDGVALGLHLRDWRRKFGDRCVVEGDQITLDLTEAKAFAKEVAEGDGEINLDPSIGGTSETGWTIHSPGTSGNNWTNARSNGTDAFSGEPGTGPRVLSYGSGEPNYYFTLERAYFQFDTSGLGRVANATLYLTPTYLHTSDNGAVITKVADYGTLTSADHNFPLGTQIGLLPTPIVDQEENWVVPAGEVDTSGKTCFTARQKSYDADNVAPADGANHGLVFHPFDHGTYPPHLDVEVSGVPGGMMRIGTGS